jgi:predicted amidohydrolase YtcJ
MVVLDKSLFKIPESEVADTQVLMTIFEGKTVCQSTSI